MANAISMRSAQGMAVLLASCMWLTACATSSAMRDDETIRIATEDASVVLKVSGDADGDGDADVLIVIDRDRDQADHPRGLMIFLRGPDGSLTEALESPEAILCGTCGGMMGDPLQGLIVEKGELTLLFEGGSRELWSSEYGFAYVPEHERWRLVRIVHHGLDRLEGTFAERKETVPGADNVYLERFNPAGYPADPIP